MKITKDYLKQIIKEELGGLEEMDPRGQQHIAGDSATGKKILEVQLVLLKMKQQPKYKPPAEEIEALVNILREVRALVNSKGL